MDLMKTIAFFLLLISNLASTVVFAQVDLPDEDPTREWRGEEYAEVILAKFRARYPDIALIIDENEIGESKGRIENKLRDKKGAADDGKPAIEDKSFDFKEGFKLFIKDPTGKGLVNNVKSMMTGPLAELIHQLEHGWALTVDLKNPDDPDEAKNIEYDLREWVVDHLEGELAPDELMVEALRRTNGHVVAAWGIAWNVMSEGWENVPTRNYSKILRRFVSVTGERHRWNGGIRFIVLPEKERVAAQVKIKGADGVERVETVTPKLRMTVSKRGDDFSTIYHRIGVELLTIVAAKRTGSAKLGWAMGSVGAMGEFLKWTQTAGMKTERRKRIGNDLNGAVSGGRIYAAVTTGRYPSLPVAEAKASHYLVSNPRKYGKDYQLPDGRPAHYFGLDVDPKYWAPVMSLEEMKMRFDHAANYDSEALNEVVLGASDDYDRLMKGLAAYEKAGAPDREFNALVEKFAIIMSTSKPSPVVKDVQHDLDIDQKENQFMLEHPDRAFGFNRAVKEIGRRLVAIINLEYASRRAEKKQAAVPAASVPLKPNPAVRFSCSRAIP